MSEKSIITLAILFSLCFVALLWFLNQNKIPQTAPTPTPISTKPIESNNNWETYKNNINFFEFSYPSGWTNNEKIASDTGDLVYIVSPNKSLLRIYIFPDNSQTISDYLIKIDKENSTGWEGSPSINIISTKKTIIAGLNCIQRQENLNAAGFLRYSTYFKKGKNIYQLVLQPENGGDLNTKDIDTYQKILSTFKFTESKIISPTNVQSLIKSIKYNLPSNWLSVRDDSQLFEVGYDPINQDIKMSKTNIEIKDKISNPNQVITNVANYKIVDYNSGSRHTLLYSYFGGNLTSQDKFIDFKEVEYQIDGKNCLFLNGISYSQFPTVWGVCPITTSKVLLITTSDRQNFTKFLSTIKFKL